MWCKRAIEREWRGREGVKAQNRCARAGVNTKSEFCYSNM